MFFQGVQGAHFPFPDYPAEVRCHFLAARRQVVQPGIHFLAACRQLDQPGIHRPEDRKHFFETIVKKVHIHSEKYVEGKTSLSMFTLKRVHLIGTK